MRDNRLQEWTQNLVIATVALSLVAITLALTWRVVAWILP